MIKKVCIIGSGELGKQIYNLSLSFDDIEVVGFFDDFKDKNTTVVNSITVLGKLSEISEFYINGFFDFLLNGIGYNHMEFRETIFDMFEDKIPFVNLIHKTAIVDSTSKIGTGVIIYPGCIIDKNVIIQHNVLINLGVVIAHDSFIGSGSFIAPGVVISGFSELERSCFLGSGTIISNNITIIRGCAVGAGSVVVKNLDVSGLYFGVPARFIRP